MDQTEARKLAREIIDHGHLTAVATQESRLLGDWPKPGEPWVVAFGTHVVDSREVAVAMGWVK